jgi:hypothetical protein
LLELDTIVSPDTLKLDIGNIPELVKFAIQQGVTSIE